tara:strand:+ start:507 stop:848 length:342 start_codon:yes stop_codon:yes gene_type:complete
MNIKMISTLVVAAAFLSVNLIAAEYNASKKPELTLESSDMELIEKAIKGNFKNLSTKDKKQLKAFLNDYKQSAKSVKINKGATSPKGKYKKKSKKGNNIYSNGEIQGKKQSSN